jgi:tetratricopeptide (TPR) repeat protein/tRNA A-37 threonylcarbamoyl transferase component Bud32
MSARERDADGPDLRKPAAVNKEGKGAREPGREPDRDLVGDELDAGLAAAFGQPTVHRDPDHTVLAAISRITGEAPKVLLRDESSAHAFTPLLKRSSEGASLPRGRGQYQLLGEIARGGMGVVLKGHDLDLGRDVAVKVMHAELAKRPDILQRFVEEAQIGGQLQHPGIVPVYELGLMADDRPYFAMKLVKGKTLASLLSERKSPSDDRRHFLDVFEAMCQTLAYCHSRGVIHRDLKPSNVMVGAFGEVQVVDWGLSKVIRQGGNDDERRAKERHTQISIIETVRSGSGSVGTDSMVGSIMGTVAYMPPEQARGDIDRVDERSDVFALGAILCEILTGLPPYPGQREEAMSNAAMGRTEAAFERLDGCGVEQALIELTKECLLPAQDARPRNAQVLAQRIKVYLGSVEERATQARIEAAEAQVKAGEERKARKLTLLLAGSVLVTLLVGGGGWVSMRMDREARARQTSEQVNAALSEVGLAQGAKDWSGAQAAVARARAALDAGVATSEIEARVREVSQAVERGARLEQQRLEREAKNVAFLERLDSIRSLGSAPVPGPGADSVESEAFPENTTARSSESHRPQAQPGGGHFVQVTVVAPLSTPEQCDDAYVQAFKDYGVDVDGRAEADTPSVLRASGIAAEIALVLDEWAELRREIDRGWADRSTRLVRLAMEIDDDSWRRDLREAVLADDPKALLALTASSRERDLSPVTAVVLGQALARAGKVESSVELLRTVQVRHPSDAPLLLQLGRRLLDLEPPRPKQAMRYLIAARALQPGSAAVLVWLADAYANRGQYDEAIASFQESLRLDPQNASARVGIDRLLQLKKDLGESVQAIRRNSDLDPGSALVQFKAALALYAGNDTNGAIECLRRAVALDPEMSAAHLALGECLEAKGYLDAAIECYAKGIEIEPDFAEGAYHLGLAYKGKHDLDAAIEYVRASTQLAPGVAGFQLQLGILLAEKGDVNAAIEVFRKVTEFEPQNGWAHYDLAIYLYQQGDLDAGIASCSRAIECETQEASFRIELGLILDKKGDVDGAIQAFRTAIGLDPRDAVAHYDLGSELERKGDIEVAIEGYRKAIDLDPGFAYAHNSLGSVLERKGSHEAATECFRKAEEFFRKAVEAGPRDADAHNSYASFLATVDDPRFRNPREAVRLAERAVELEPMNGTNWNTLGIARYRIGDWEGCIDAQRRSRELNSQKNPSDRLFLAMAHQRLGHATEAQEWYQRALEWAGQHAPIGDEMQRFQAEAEETLGSKGATKDKR